MIFMEQVERRLETLDVESRALLLMQSLGYTQVEMAKSWKISLRTLARRMREVNRAAFEELTSEWQFPLRIPRCASAGKRLGRPRKRAA